MEPRIPRRARPSMGDLAERVTRVETMAEHVQEALGRIDAAIAQMQRKIDSLAGNVAQGMGGLRVGAVVAQLAAGALGFIAAHLWPVK